MKLYRCLRWRLLLCGVTGAAALAGEPRLILTPERVQQLRASVRVAGSAHEAMFRQLQAKVDAAGALPAAERSNYELSYRATSAAFLYQLTGEAQYCVAAARALRDIYASVTAESLLPDQGYGLARATVGLGFAFAHDWCGEALPEADRAWVRATLERAADAWVDFRHANVEAEHKGSNWVSVCRGGELIELIALRREQSHAARFRLVKADLRRHMQNFDELGVSQEGIGYTAYGGIFLLRALLALRAIGDADLEAEAARHGWWKQAMYSGTFAERNGSRRWLPSGVSGDGIGDEGWASLLFAFTPRDQQPYFAWWYDRHIGSRAAGAVTNRFDHRREGPVWALLCYDAEVVARDPSGVFPRAVSGSGGLTFFRNRWRDADDILVSFHADTAWHSHAWDQPEALQWHLFAYGTLMAGGPDKTREAANFTTLLVDGRHVADARKNGTTGKLVKFAPSALGGVVVASGGSQYTGLGVDVTRTFEVEFLEGNRARVRVRDEVGAEGSHRYTWQVKTPAAVVDGMRVRVLAPEAHRVDSGPPYRVEAEGAAVRFDVVVEVGVR